MSIRIYQPTWKRLSDAMHTRHHTFVNAIRRSWNPGDRAIWHPWMYSLCIEWIEITQWSRRRSRVMRLRAVREQTKARRDACVN